MCFLVRLDSDSLGAFRRIVKMLAVASMPTNLYLVVREIIQIKSSRLKCAKLHKAKLIKMIALAEINLISLSTKVQNEVE